MVGGGEVKGKGEYREGTGSTEGGRRSNEGGGNRRRKGGERGRDKHSIRNFTDKFRPFHFPLFSPRNI